jgi:hypothetical protein
MSRELFSMKTFKKLGYKVERNQRGLWTVTGKDLYYESHDKDANKGMVVAEALLVDDNVMFVKGTGWVRK